MAAGSAVIHVSAMSVMFGKVSEKMAEVGKWGMAARIPVLRDMAV
jgi:hypothetical protein